MATNTDIFGKPKLQINHPVTADLVYINWDGVAIYQATNIQMSYQQPTNRRYTLSSPQNQAVIVPGRPVGNLTIGRLYVASQQDIFTSLNGWNTCLPPATLIITMAGSTAQQQQCATSSAQYTISGAYVRDYNLTADADSLQVMDNISIEFLQLEVTGLTKVA